METTAVFSTSALREFNLVPQLSKISRYKEQWIKEYITVVVSPAVVFANFHEQLEVIDLVRTTINDTIVVLFALNKNLEVRESDR